MKLLLFGMLHDLVPADSDFDSIHNTGQLRKKLAELNPIFDQIPYNIAINLELINSENEIESDDEVAIMPMYSGG